MTTTDDLATRVRDALLACADRTGLVAHDLDGIVAAVCTALESQLVALDAALGEALSLLYTVARRINDDRTACWCGGLAEGHRDHSRACAATRALLARFTPPTESK